MCIRDREAEVLAALDTMEVRIGSRRNAVPTSQLGGELMASDPRIAWAGARLDGVTLRVSLQEAEAIPQLPSGGQKTPVSIYAAKDGVITSITVYDGKAKVHVGDAVLALSLIHISPTMNAFTERAFRYYTTQLCCGQAQAKDPACTEKPRN